MQFFGGPKAKQDPKRVQSMGLGALHIVPPVADHDGFRGRRIVQTAQRFLDDFALLRNAAVDGRAADDRKVTGQVKMVQNALGEYLGFGGRQRQRAPGGLQAGERFRDAVIDPVFKQPDLFIAAAVSILAAHRGVVV